MVRVRVGVRVRVRLVSARRTSGVSAHVQPSCAASRRCDCRMYICAPSPSPRWYVVCSVQPAGSAPTGRRQLQPLPGTWARPLRTSAPRSCWRPSGRQVVARRRRAWWPAGSQPMPRGPCDAGGPGCDARGMLSGLRSLRLAREGVKLVTASLSSPRQGLPRANSPASPGKADQARVGPGLVEHRQHVVRGYCPSCEAMRPERAVLSGSVQHSNACGIPRVNFRH